MRLLILLEALLANGYIFIGSFAKVTEVLIARVKRAWARTKLEWVILGKSYTRMGDLTPLLWELLSLLSVDLSDCLSMYSSGSSFDQSMAKKTSS